MKKDKKMTKFITYDYYLKEIIDKMHESIEKINTLIPAQEKLAAYLEKSEDKDSFKDFIDNLRKSNEQYNEQLKVLAHRIDCLEAVYSDIEDSVETERVMSLLLDGLGVVNKEGKSVEEREKNRETSKEVSYEKC